METFDEASDAQLVVAIGRYRDDALAEAYRRHAGAVFGLARRILGDAGQAEDITQEVFLQLWDSPDRYDPERGSLRTFLLTVTHGRAVDLVRSREARLRREERDARAARANPAYERELDDLVLADQVSRALAALPAAERAAIELAYFGGHTYGEVASLLAEPEGTVKSRIRSGLRRMKRQLSGNEVVEA
jgi:RNA polymerase sigma-70 factor (ECF subfamily)